MTTHLSTRAARLGWTLLGLLLLIVPAQAQNRVGTTAAPFLTLGTGARGQALGHAYTATATGGDALFWNPAAAARPSGVDGRGSLGSAFVTHYTWFAGIRYDALGVTIPVGGQRVLGFSVGRVDYGRQDVTNEFFPDGTGETYGAADLVVGLSYAQALTPQFYLGGTVKAVQQSIWDMNASTVAFDIGFLLDLPRLRGARLAASIQHFGGKMQMEGVNARVFYDPAEDIAGNNDAVPARYQTDRWDLPLSFRLGLSAVAVQAGPAQVRLLTDVQQTNDNALNSDFGAEARYLGEAVTLALRGGYRDLHFASGTSVDAHWSYGAGLELDLSGVRVGFDAALVPFERLGMTRMFDARLYF